MVPHLFGRLINKLCAVIPGGFCLRPQLQRLRGVNIGRHVWISQCVYIDELHPEVVTIGDYATIGLKTSIITHCYYGPRRKNSGFKKVVIEKNVFVGPHCLVLPGSTIGEGAVIKGGTTISQHIPPHTLWGPQDNGPIAIVTVPLTPAHSYQDFIRGLRPIRTKK